MTLLLSIVAPVTAAAAAAPAAAMISAWILITENVRIWAWKSWRAFLPRSIASTNSIWFLRSARSGMA